MRVYRTINLDLEWSVENVVERLAPREGGFTTSVPILAGEHVSTPGFKLRDGKLTLAMADRESQTGWSSTLEQSSTLALSAPELGSHAEVWRILAGPTWHVEFSGVPETATTSADGDGFHEFEFHPLPGETLTVHVTKPAAVEGATRAIDDYLTDKPEKMIALSGGGGFLIKGCVSAAAAPCTAGADSR